MSRKTLSAVASMRPRNSKLESLNLSKLKFGLQQIGWESTAMIREVRQSHAILRLNLAPDLPAAQHQRTPRLGAKRFALLPNHQSVFRGKKVLLPPTSLTNTVSRWSCCWRRRGLGLHLVLSRKAQRSRVKSSGVAGGVATVFSVTCKSQCLHRVALSLPRQLETTPVSEVVSALCGSRIFADAPPAHHDLGCPALITQVVRNGSFARVLRTRIAMHLPGIHVSGLDIEYSSLVVGGQRDPTGKRRV